MIEFVRPEDASDWGDVDPHLRLLVLECEAWLSRVGIHRTTITSLKHGRRYPPHVEGRAADLRVRDIPEELREGLVSWINQCYQWPPNALGRPWRPTAIYEREGERAGRTVATGDHIHLQVPRKGLGEVSWSPTLTRCLPGAGGVCLDEGDET